MQLLSAVQLLLVLLLAAVQLLPDTPPLRPPAPPHGAGSEIESRSEETELPSLHLAMVAYCWSRLSVMRQPYLEPCHGPP